MRIGSLFSGAGGLDLAVAAVFDGEILWHAEIDKAASKVLAHRFPGVPNLGDITAVGWADVPAVDVLCGGFPCQDVSAAGKRAGIKDGTRSGLWTVFAEAIDALRPQYVVIENVRGLLSAAAHRTVEDDGQSSDMESGAAVVGDGAGRPVLRAAGAVLGDLCDLGYDAQWTTLAAAAVGAPHRRERVFVLAADTKHSSPGGRWPRCGEAIGVWQTGGAVRHSANASDSPRDGWHEGRPEPSRLVGRSDAAVGGDEPGVALLPTPCVVDRLATTDMTLDQWDESRRSQKERGVGSFGPRGDSLGAAVLRVEEGTVDERPDYSSSSRKSDTVELLPTPAACNPNDGETPETWLRRRDEVKYRVGNGNGMGMPLSIAVQLLPTPTTQDGSNNGGPSQHQRNTLPLNAEVTLLPTPEAKNSHAGPDYARMNREGSGGHDLVTALSLLPTHAASDATGGGSHPDSRQGHTRQLIDYALLLCTPSAADGGGGGHLSRSGDRKHEQLLPGQAREMSTAWGKYEPAIRRWEQIVGPAPAPTEPNKNGNPRLSAAFSEWMMGWPPGWVTDPAIGISRNDQLRIVGNGVCPQQAIAALRFLLSMAVYP